MSASSSQATSSSVEITILYFASARTAVDKSSEKIQLPSSSFLLSDLPELLLSRYDNSSELKMVLGKSALSVNEEIVYETEETVLRQGDVVAIIPPVSGG